LKARLYWVVVLGVMLAILPAAALGGASRAATNSQSFPDSTGEDANAPDVSSVDVSNDDAGMITLKVNISNRPALTQDMLMLVLLNTDQNAATGDPTLLGADYAIQLIPGAVGLFQWNSTDFVAAASQTSLTYGYDATGATFRISAADLGKTTTFGFAVIAVSGLTTDASGNPDFTNAHSDTAPDAGHGLYTYNVLTKLVLTQTAFTTSPTPARAGKRFTASLGATENDTNGPVSGATVTCTARIGTKRIPGTHTLANGVASCVWKLPKTAKGKTLRGTITVSLRGATLTKSFAARVH
jgi:hypothetical protein